MNKDTELRGGTSTTLGVIVSSPRLADPDQLNRPVLVGGGVSGRVGAPLFGINEIKVGHVSGSRWQNSQFTQTKWFNYCDGGWTPPSVPYLEVEDLFPRLRVLIIAAG